MAKASRSSKKQPDFDPTEIEDLIFSPAVGKGVGSHLVATFQPPTVVTSLRTPIVTDDVAIETLQTPTDLTQDSQLDTGSTRYVPTVVISPDLGVTPVSIDVATVALSDTSLWITDHGDLVSAARVKRIRLAQDVINSAEESVYDTLWNAKLIRTDDSSRLVQAGYDYLVKRTRLSRKTIQRIVAKLLEKDFIEVDTRADIYQRTATVYRVFSYKSVLDRNARKGRLYVAKMGPGFSYARPLQTPSNMTTVANPHTTTVAIEQLPPVAKQSTVTVVKNDRPTVVKMSPHLLDTKTIDSSSSYSLSVHSALSSYGSVDDDVLHQLLAACRSYAPDCTDAEIVHFVHDKGRLIQRKDSRVQNPLGFLLTAVPKCFSGHQLSEFRAAQSRELIRAAETLASGATEDPALARWRKQQEAALSDPSVSEQEKHLIRLCLGLNVPHS